MARVKGMQQVVGTIGKVSFYTIQGGEQVYVRAKGGPTRRAIKTKPQFEKLRCNNNEWKGCARMGRLLRFSYHKLNFLEDYPAIGSLNGLAKKIQMLDTEAAHGQRNLYLSRQRELLLGFCFTKKQVFENVLRMPLQMDVNRDTGIARIRVPAFDTADHLYNFAKQSFFRLHFALDFAVDVLYDPVLKSYAGCAETYSRGNKYFVSEWFPTAGNVPAMDIELSCSYTEGELPDAFTYVLSAGIEFGKTDETGSVTGVKYCSSGKIMRVA